MASSHKQNQGVVGGRARADSVLGGRMDDNYGFKSMNSSSSKWRKVRSIIDRKTTKLCLFEVPRGVSCIRSWLMTVLTETWL